MLSRTGQLHQKRILAVWVRVRPPADPGVRQRVSSHIHILFRILPANCHPLPRITTRPPDIGGPGERSVRGEFHQIPVAAAVEEGVPSTEGPKPGLGEARGVDGTISANGDIRPPVIVAAANIRGPEVRARRGQLGHIRVTEPPEVIGEGSRAHPARGIGFPGGKHIAISVRRHTADSIVTRAADITGPGQIRRGIRIHRLQRGGAGGGNRHGLPVRRAPVGKIQKLNVPHARRHIGFSETAFMPQGRVHPPPARTGGNRIRRCDGNGNAARCLRCVQNSCDKTVMVPAKRSVPSVPHPARRGGLARHKHPRHGIGGNAHDDIRARAAEKGGPQMRARRAHLHHIPV